MIEAERLKIDQQEVAIQAKTEGVKIRAQREQAQQQRNMDLMKMIGATKNNQNTPKRSNNWLKPSLTCFKIRSRNKRPLQRISYHRVVRKTIQRYREVCGLLRGLRSAHAIIEDLSRNYMDGDDD
jgi:hypothetical protein